MVELRHYRYFVAVAETLHFGRAAERLHMAQPPLSIQIKQLEAEVGTPLFERNRRRVRLTAAGEVFLEEARRVLAASERALEAAREAGQGLRGRLQIGFISSAPLRLVPSILRSYRARYPGVTLVLQELGSAQQLLGVQERRLDAGFVRLPCRATGLRIEQLASEPLIAALPDEHPLAALSVIPLAALGGEPFVTFPRHVGPGLYDQIRALCTLAGFTPQVHQEVEQMPAIVGLVGAGLGVALVPESIGLIQAPGVVYRALEQTALVSLGLACRESERHPLVDALLETALAHRGASPE